MIINELGRRLNQIMSILLTMNKHRLHLLLHFVLHMPNIIKLKLYDNWSVQAVNTSESAIWNSSKPIKFLIFKHQPINKAHVIEITKTCLAAFMKARNSLVVRCREKHFSWEKKQKMVKIYFLKRELTGFG